MLPSYRVLLSTPFIVSFLLYVAYSKLLLLHQFQRQTHNAFVSSKFEQPHSNNSMVYDVIGYLLLLLNLIAFLLFLLPFCSLPRLSCTSFVLDWHKHSVAHRGYRSGQHIMMNYGQKTREDNKNNNNKSNKKKEDEDDEDDDTPVYYTRYSVPENSLYSFALAHEHGCAVIELDTQLTKDGVPVVIHDATLERVLDGVGNVRDVTLAQIKNLTYREVEGEKYQLKQEINKKLDLLHVPTLEEVLIFCKQRNMRVMIELKESFNPALIRERIIQLIDKHDMKTLCFVATFNAWHLYCFRRVRRDIATCLLFCYSSYEKNHIVGSKEVLLPWFIDYRVVRLAADYLLRNLAGTILCGVIGCDIVGPDVALVSNSLLQHLHDADVLPYIWVVNSSRKLRELQHKQCMVATDRLFPIPLPKATKSDYDSDRDDQDDNDENDEDWTQVKKEEVLATATHSKPSSSTKRSRSRKE